MCAPARKGPKGLERQRANGTNCRLVRRLVRGLAVSPHVLEVSPQVVAVVAGVIELSAAAFDTAPSA